MEFPGVNGILNGLSNIMDTNTNSQPAQKPEYIDKLFDAVENDGFVGYLTRAELNDGLNSLTNNEDIILHPENYNSDQVKDAKQFLHKYEISEKELTEMKNVLEQLNKKIDINDGTIYSKHLCELLPDTDMGYDKETIKQALSYDDNPEDLSIDDETKIEENYLTTNANN